MKITVDPQVIALHCRLAKPGESYALHSHPFDEFTLVTQSTTQVIYSAGQRPTQPDTLLLYRRGEQHGAWNTAKQAPRYWVVNFCATPSLYRQTGNLAKAEPARRVWQLSPDQSETFKWLFLQILSEQIRQQREHGLAASLWLRLLLLYVERWAAGETIAVVPRQLATSDLLNLWHAVNASAEKPAEALERIHALPNYDSLRHSFKKAFGLSPRRMMTQLRIQFAKNLLLESPLSIKEIATRCGYVRQHEFARVFHERVGIAPSKWRRNPFLAKNPAPPN